MPASSSFKVRCVKIFEEFYLQSKYNLSFISNALFKLKDYSNQQCLYCQKDIIEFDKRHSYIYSTYISTYTHVSYELIDRGVLQQSHDEVSARTDRLDRCGITFTQKINLKYYIRAVVYRLKAQRGSSCCIICTLGFNSCFVLGRVESSH